VGKDEADMTKNYIYFRSPIGKALIGKNKKDLVAVKTPSGEKNFEIAEIKYI
jgi:transcription elongation factor GreA